MPWLAQRGGPAGVDHQEHRRDPQHDGGSTEQQEAPGQAQVGPAHGREEHHRRGNECAAHVPRHFQQPAPGGDTGALWALPREDGVDDFLGTLPLVVGEQAGLDEGGDDDLGTGVVGVPLSRGGLG